MYCLTVMGNPPGAGLENTLMCGEYIYLPRKQNQYWTGRYCRVFRWQKEICCITGLVAIMESLRNGQPSTVKKIKYSLYLIVLLLPVSEALWAEKCTGIAGTTGQTVYIPAYATMALLNGSSVPLSANLNVFNTDRKNPIVITSVAYYDSNGQLIERQLQEQKILPPLGAARFFIKATDVRGGFGANFLVAWKSSVPVSEPVIEAVMVGSYGTRAFSFLSHGRVIASGE